MAGRSGSRPLLAKVQPSSSLSRRLRPANSLPSPYNFTAISLCSSHSFNRLCRILKPASRCLMECYRSDENERRRRIVQLALEAYVLARSAVVGAAEVLIRDGESACAAVQAVEQRLDDLDRSMDEHVADAISNVGPQEARDLLACVKAMVDLERIGDLAQSFASRARTVRERIATEDINLLL